MTFAKIGVQLRYMVIEAAPETPDSATRTLPFEEQGVCVVVTENKKQFFFTNYSQRAIDIIEDAVKAREAMSPSGIFREDNLARRIYANTHIPWGEPLMNYEQSLPAVLGARSEVEFILKQTPNQAVKNSLIKNELIRRIERLGELGDWQQYSAKFLAR